MAMFPGDHAYPAPPSRDLSLIVPYEGDFVDKSGRRLEKIGLLSGYGRPVLTSC